MKATNTIGRQIRYLRLFSHVSKHYSAIRSFENHSVFIRDKTVGLSALIGRRRLAGDAQYNQQENKWAGHRKHNF